MAEQVFDFTGTLPATSIVVEGGISEENPLSVDVEVDGAWQAVSVVVGGTPVAEVESAGAFPLDWQDCARYRLTASQPFVAHLV